MQAEKTVKKRKRRVVRKRSVVDSAARNAASLTDGCNPEFVIGAVCHLLYRLPIFIEAVQLDTAFRSMEYM